MADVDFFIGALNRLKESLGVSKDKQVAEALGLTDKAFNARKARKSFPEIDLLALSARRPELKMDVTYVLTGERVSDRDQEVLTLTAKTISEMEPEGDGPLHQAHRRAAKMAGTKKLVRQSELDKLKNALSDYDDDAFKLVMDTALSLAERLPVLREKQAKTGVKKAEKNTA
jgi:hypothetical protein